MNELVFEVIQEEDGGYVAECLTASVRPLRSTSVYTMSDPVSFRDFRGSCPIFTVSTLRP